MANIDKLLEVMAALRDPQDGCPWDVEQDFASIAPYTVEEAYEVFDAIERRDMDALRDELGDLLLQVVFHSRMAAEAGHFDFDDVAGGITDKLVRRHPHVFGSDEERAVGKAAGSWERIKAEERHALDDTSALAGVALALPALKRAEKLGKRASATGFDWPDERGVRDKITEEINEVAHAVGTGDSAHVEEELGDLLFTVANLARHLGCDPEHALARANAKFERRFRIMEASIGASGESMQGMPADALEAAWQAAKRRIADGESGAGGGPADDS